MTRPPASLPVALAVCGDPISGRALVLLLRGGGYDASFLPVSSLGKPGSLGNVQLLLLTPMSELFIERHEVLLRSLKDTPETAKIPILELITAPGGTREGGAQEGSRHVVPWPCNTEELERRIEAVLLATRRREDLTNVGKARGESK